MTETERARFHSLRQQELAGGTLTTEEFRELAEYVSALEAEETVVSQSSREERETQLALLNERVAQMRSLVARREALADYLRRIAQEVDAEREAIDAAFQQLIVKAEPSAKNLAGATR